MLMETQGERIKNEISQKGSNLKYAKSARAKEIKASTSKIGKNKNTKPTKFEIFWSENF